MNPVPTDPQILPATDADLPAIAALARLIWRACYPGIISEEQIDYMLLRMYALETMRGELQSGIRYERLILDGNLAGFAAWGPTERPEEFKLHKLYLHPERQGLGLGRRLLEYCQASAGRQGARQLTLAVNKRNAKALALYQRNGFKVTKSVVVDIGNGFVMDDYWMTKELPPSAKAEASPAADT